MKSANLKSGSLSTSCSIEINGRDILKELSIEKVDAYIRPGKHNKLVLHLAAAELEICGVPVLAIHTKDGRTLFGRFVCDDGTEYP